MWTNFAKDLTPTVGETVSDELAGVDWEAVDPSGIWKRFLFIDLELEMGEWTEWEERMQFWDDILDEGCSNLY